MANNAKIEVRVDARTKANVEIILKRIGIKMSEAIRIYLQKIIITNSIPFEIKTRRKILEFPNDRLLSVEEMKALFADLTDED